MLAIYTVHDLHKDPDAERGDRGEFDVALNEFREEAEALGLFDFADVTVEQMRLGMMHLNKKMVGDYLAAPSNTSKLISIVRLADTLASIQEPSDYQSLAVRLNELSPRLIGRYKFYHHELNEFRGLTTQLLHLSISDILEKQYDCFPLLFFANGVMYIGPASAPNGTSSQQDNFITAINKDFFTALQRKMQAIGGTVAGEALNPQQTVKFEQYAYLFSDAAQMLTSLTTYASKKAPKLFISELVAKRAEAKREGKRPSFATKFPSKLHFCQRYEINPEAESDDDFATKWWAVSQVIKGVESIARDMLGDKVALTWILETLGTPESVKMAVISDIAELRAGGVADHALIISYHYLEQQTYLEDGRSVRAVDISDVLLKLNEYLIPHIEHIVTTEARQAVVDSELALKQDLDAYLIEGLQCSNPAFSSLISTPANVFVEYQERRKGSSYQHLCVLCSRVIPDGMKNPVIKTGILEDQALVFSNKLVPREKVGAQMVWCPMCYLEFMLRRLSGLNYPRAANSGLSDRLYIYLFPDYFFTPEYVAHMERMLRPFKEGTALKLRQYGKEDTESLPVMWIRERRFSAKMQRDAIKTLRKEAIRLGKDILDKKGNPIGKKRRDLTGDKQHSSQLTVLNYLMILCEKSAVKASPELAPTRSELWSKAIYMALVAYQLLGVRVYITDKPYLTVSSPTELKSIITLDAPHALLRGLLNQSANDAVIRLVKGKGEQEGISVQDAMDAMSALWLVNEFLTGHSTSGRRRNLDKGIASLLEQINSNPLAGAAFYKERQRDDLPTTREFTMACMYLLELIGGWKLDLAKRLAHQSLAIFLPPWSKDGKGKANQYERLFRLALEALKKMPRVEDPDEMKSRIAGALEKAVLRQRELGKGASSTGLMNCRDEELKDRSYEFASTIVDELFIRRCGRNISKLLTEENSLADGIYHITDCELSKYREEFFQRLARRKAAASGGQDSSSEVVVALNEGYQD